MPMKDSRMPDSWVQQQVAANPIAVAPQTGNILTGPVRLAFVNLLQPGKPMEGDTDSAKKPTYNCVVLFPVGFDVNGFQNVLVKAWTDLTAQHFPGQHPASLHNPFRDQAIKANYAGYNPGCPFISVATTQKPQVVDTAGNPLIDENRVYPGVWALVSVRAFEFGLRPARPKKGVTFGLQSVMIIADDEKLGGSAPPAMQDFANVRVGQDFNPSGAFGNTPTAPLQQTPGGVILPPSTPVFTGQQPHQPLRLHIIQIPRRLVRQHQVRPHRDHQLQLLRHRGQRGRCRPGVERRSFNPLDVVQVQLGD